jgi:hypothetical protein
MMSQTASDSLLSDPHNCLNVSFGVGVGVGVAVGVAVGEGEGVAEAVAVGFGAALIATPLFQTNRVPDLTHVNFFPPEIEVAPAFEHELPALGEAACKGAARRVSDNIDATIAQDFLIGKKYGTYPTIRNTPPTITYS